MAINRILVTTDGSDFAARAFPYANALARSNGAAIVLLHVTGGGTDDGRLEQAAAMLRANNVDVRAIAGAGDVVGEIIATAEREHASTIVMATHGRSGLGRLIFGSTANEVLKVAPCPVTLVPAHTPLAPDYHEPTVVIAPVDGSALAEQAIAAAVGFAESVNGTVLLARIVEYPNPAFYTASDPSAAMVTAQVIEETADFQRQQAQQYLEELVTRIDRGGANLQTTMVEGFPADAIVRLAAEQRARAIVMATRGRSGLGAALLGSVTTGVIQRSTVPVVVVRGELADAG